VWEWASGSEAALEWDKFACSEGDELLLKSVGGSSGNTFEVGAVTVPVLWHCYPCTKRRAGLGHVTVVETRLRRFKDTSLAPYKATAR